MTAMPQRPEGQFGRKCREVWRGGRQEPTTTAGRTSAAGCRVVECDWPTVHRKNRRKQMSRSVTRVEGGLNREFKNFGCGLAKHSPPNLWRGSLLPLGCEAVVNHDPWCHWITEVAGSGLLRNPAGASSLATGFSSFGLSLSANRHTYLIFKYHCRLSDLPPPCPSRLIGALFCKVRSWKTFAQQPALPCG
jgi:hypothetical protein